MDYNYVKALVTRAKWKKWVEEGNLSSTLNDGTDKLYYHTLTCGDTFFMNHHFCKMVDTARRTIPDDLEFDISWLQEPSGWLYLAEPAELPVLEGLSEVAVALQKQKLRPTMTAIGWLCLKSIEEDTPDPDGVERVRKLNAIPDNDGVYRQGLVEIATSPAEATAVEFLVFLGFDIEGFAPWSYFSLRTGEKVLDRLHQYEGNITERGANYIKCREADELHEVRWIYTAFHLMAQRFAMRVQHTPDRATRRRSEREGTPVASLLKVVTLRKLEEERAKGTCNVDWQWQWTVGGHWRNQYLPSNGEHKRIWVDSYVKGPDDKPMKPVPMKIFVARR